MARPSTPARRCRWANIGNLNMALLLMGGGEASSSAARCEFAADAVRRARRLLKGSGCVGVRPLGRARPQ